ncbi:hypothetical protein [Falsiphaeobacter marinintestinus]|uniref:hypothetical protein n=1 Tax=Falsiphaeobacter marinintestinus TaxID=1492905 RepID=UPI0011B725D7|nr:hypothetical protein [Phaeobacter marinintestinus]
MRDDLPRLLEIVKVQYLKEQERMRAVLAEESALRGKLAKLDELADQAQTDLSQPQAMQQIGADLLWQSWRDRTRRQLNQELAQIMARKQPFQEKLKASFGRKTALERMIVNDTLRRKKTAAQRRDERLLDRL